MRGRTAASLWTSRSLPDGGEAVALRAQANGGGARRARRRRWPLVWQANGGGARARLREQRLLVLRAEAGGDRVRGEMRTESSERDGDQEIFFISGVGPTLTSGVGLIHSKADLNPT